MVLSHTRTSEKAFTLVEILVVVVILGLAGAIVVPSLSQPSSFSVQAAGRAVIADILIAQNDAVASQSPRSVVFDPALNRYRLIDNLGATLQVAWKAGDVANYVIDFNADTRFRGVTVQIDGVTGLPVDGGTGLPTVTFDALGAPNVGGTVDLVAVSTRYRITITPFTGRVTITEVP